MRSVVHEGQGRRDAAKVTYVVTQLYDAYGDLSSSMPGLGTLVGFQHGEL
jgi:hypothetical protein